MAATEEKLKRKRTRSVNRFLPVSDGNYSEGYYVCGVHVIFVFSVLCC
ncbi:hypothetical protein T11_11353 [Trichinella zimbabwensis]|uniref:Uncharacterized protein n=1 Tax=Trichinella zimbabwensis TaxID=268475 RepID=A0A0V1H5V6_9BILA|nr:hypothetical protein T11_11353 [Trichinella zimbabwensis]